MRVLENNKGIGKFAKGNKWKQYIEDKRWKLKRVKKNKMFLIVTMCYSSDLNNFYNKKFNI